MAPVFVKERNTIEIPAELAERLGIAPGSQVYVYQLGESLSVRPKPSEVLEAAEEFEGIMREQGATLDDLLKGLAEEREVMAKQRPGGDSPDETV